MADIRKARALFELGVLSLNIPVEGQEPVHDPAQAAKAFTRATEWDPSVGDAWIGRLACGDASNEVLLGLYRTRATIGAELPPLLDKVAEWLAPRERGALEGRAREERGVIIGCRGTGTR